MAEELTLIQTLQEIQENLVSVPVTERKNLKQWCQKAGLPYKEFVKFLFQLDEVCLISDKPLKEITVENLLKILKRIIDSLEETTELAQLSSTVPVEKLPQLLQDYEKHLAQREKLITKIKELGVNEPSEIERIINLFLEKQAKFAQQKSVTKGKKPQLSKEEEKNLLALSYLEEKTRAIVKKQFKIESDEAVDQQLVSSLTAAVATVSDLPEGAQYAQLTPLVTLALVASPYHSSLNQEQDPVPSLVEMLINQSGLKQIAPFAPSQVIPLLQAEVKTNVANYLNRIGITPSNENQEKAFAHGVEAITKVLVTPYTRFPLKPTATSLLITPMPKKVFRGYQGEPGRTFLAAIMKSSGREIFREILPTEMQNPLLQNVWLATTFFSAIDTEERRKITDQWQTFSSTFGFPSDPIGLLNWTQTIVAGRESIFTYVNEIPQINHSINRGLIWIQTNFQPRLTKGLLQNSVGRIINAGIEKAGQKLALRVVEKLAQKLGEKTVITLTKKIIQGTISEGLTAALATALGISTAGASILIWLGMEIIKGITNTFKGLLKRTIKRLKLDQFFDFLTAGIFRSSKNWLEKNFGLLGKIAYRIGFGTSLVLIPTSLITTALIVSFASLFIFIFISRLQFQILINTVSPPLAGRGGDQGISEDEYPSEIILEEVDFSRCQSLTGPAQIACVLTLTFQNCLPDGIITSETSTDDIEDCIRNQDYLTSILDNHQIQRIVAVLKDSADRFNVLQCVGFKRAVERKLPCCYDAKDFVGKCQHIYSPSDSKQLCQSGSEEEKDNCRKGLEAQISPGDNAVWTYGKYGHIAMVIDTETYRESGQIVVAQAWGGSGRINFTRVNIAEVAEFIRCR